jgi:exonuclease SbcC
MNRDEFFHTYFTGQKELSVMAAMCPTERGQFLSRVLGYERLRAAQDLARERRKTLVAEATGLRTGMPDPDLVQGALADAKTRIAASTRKANDFGIRRTAARRTVEEITPLGNCAARSRALRRSPPIALADGDWRPSSARSRGSIASWVRRRPRASWMAFRGAAFHVRGRAAELDRSAAGPAASERCRDRHAGQGDRAAARRASDRSHSGARDRGPASLKQPASRSMRLSELEAAQTDWVRDKQEAERRQALESEGRLRAAREQIVELGRAASARSALGRSAHFVPCRRRNQIETITVDGKYFRARIEQLAAVPADITTLGEHRRELTDAATKLERRVVEIQAGLRALSTIHADLVAKDERHTTVARELAGLAVNYDAARHGEVRALVDRLAPLAMRATKLAAQLERSRCSWKSARRCGQRPTRFNIAAPTSPVDASVGILEDACSTHSVKVRLAEVDPRRNWRRSARKRSSPRPRPRWRRRAGARELARAEERLAARPRSPAARGTGPRLFRPPDGAQRAMRPRFRFASGTSGADGRPLHRIRAGRRLRIVLLEDGIPKPVISGGEEDLANLVLRLAISEMIAERAGQSFSLLVLDEVFGSLDESRRQNVVGLLQRLHDRFEQIILITHIESVREAPVDRVITVSYDDEAGTSRVDTESPRGDPVLALHAGAAD